MSKKYAVVWNYGHDMHAGSKAPSDAIDFLLQAGYRPVVFREINTLKYFLFPFYFFRAYHMIEEGSEVVFQYPVYSRSTFRVFLRLALCLARKNVERIALVHDVNFGRDYPGVKKAEELHNLNCFSKLIVHSSPMERLLRENGCNLPCSILGLFDYKVSKTNVLPRVNEAVIVFAGHLGKSEFVSKLPLLTSNCRFNLYGIDYDGTGGENVTYKGKFRPDDLSSLEGNWGLVWDGPEIDSCTGVFGEYLRYNSPHKASLYVCAGLPLIVPQHTAVAEIVKSRGIGLAVPSLTAVADMLSKVSDEQYSRMKENCDILAIELESGFNLASAIGNIK